tara:strand:- start:29 stop:775 length:747 start_codon:yes stop_codon:yes gene_type:complete
MINLSIIGSGNVGKHFIALVQNSKDLNLIQWVSRSESCYQKIKTTSDFKNIEKADVYVICVSDSSIHEVSKTLNLRNQLIVHTSGINHFNILCDNNRRGVFYPLQTFTKGNKTHELEIPMCIESEYNEDIKLLIDLCKYLNLKYYQVDYEKRKILHLAAVFSNNFSNHLYSIAYKITKNNNIDFDILKPLIQETANKILLLEPAKAQTGPARRNDRVTINDHLKLLKNDDYKKLYKTFTELIKDENKL